MPDLDAVGHLGRTVGDHRHRGEPAASFQALDAAPPAATAALGRAGHRRVGVVDRLVDRLGAQPPGRLVSANRSRSSCATCSGLHRLPSRSTTTARSSASTITPSGTRPCDAFGRGLVRTAGQVTAVIVDVAPELPADRGRGTTQLPRDARAGALLPPQVGDHHPLVQRQIARDAGFGGVWMRTGG